MTFIPAPVSRGAIAEKLRAAKEEALRVEAARRRKKKQQAYNDRITRWANRQVARKRGQAF